MKRFSGTTMALTKPIFRVNKPKYYACHRSHVNRIIKRQASVILLGDSIVANLSRYPCVWNRYLYPLNAVNCGIGGDCTQHVLWRADNYYLPASVSTVVLSCGINNMDFYRPQDIANSILLCGTRLREKHPQIHVIVTGILPRDATVTERRIKIQQTNEILKDVCWKNDFLFVEQASYWTESSGALNQSLFWKDDLHLNKRGCDLFAKSISCAINTFTHTPTSASAPTPTPALAPDHAPAPAPTPAPTPAPPSSPPSSSPPSSSPPSPSSSPPSSSPPSTSSPQTSSPFASSSSSSSPPSPSSSSSPPSSTSYRHGSLYYTFLLYIFLIILTGVTGFCTFEGGGGGIFNTTTKYNSKLHWIGGVGWDWTG